MLASTETPSLTDRVAIRNVVVSVADKQLLTLVVQALHDGGLPVTLFATGGTLQTLHAANATLATPLAITAIEDYTGFPEMPGGLVKTLHPLIHGGLLAEPGDEAQRQYCDRLGIEAFDLAIINLYPFEAVVRQPDSSLDTARRHIDIGGPAVLRAAAKNFLRVGVGVDPADYPAIAAELTAQSGCLSLMTRWQMAQKAFQHVTDYDTAISDYLSAQSWDTVLATYDVR
ncbi:MAG: hypothetical protein H7338_01605 [Candidatus Sericytochromatia bacterium]|nr:hypothetical protein [Candidatus Sericytochromatia bacterium]